MMRAFVLSLLLLLAGCGIAQAAPAQQASPTARPSPAPTAQATPTPAPEVAAQAPALLPKLAGDLAAAGAWDRYTIVAALSPDELSVRGTVTLDLENRYGVPLNQIFFHLYPNHPDFGGRLDVTSATVDGVPVASGTQHNDTLLRLELQRPLAPNTRARVVLGFSARTPRNASADTFGAYNLEAGVWSVANFYPVLARYFAGSGWDTRPIEARGDFTVTNVALYDVTIDVPNSWALVGTGVPISSSALAGGQTRRERFVSGPQREFFLAALQGLDQASTVVDGTRIVSYYQRANPEAGRRSLQIAEASLRSFNARYGTYPLAELEIVQAALTQFLGMEYPGVVLIEQRLYANNGRGLETTIAHEIAHQWWYSQIGNDAQGEPWLDEGLASYSQVVYYEELGKAAQATAELDTFRSIYRDARARGRDAPLGSSPTALDGGRYYPVIYAKAPLFFHALRARLGDAGFAQFLQRYYSSYRYRDVAGPDLLRTAQETCGCDLRPLYNDWVLTAAAVPIP